MPLQLPGQCRCWPRLQIGSTCSDRSVNTGAELLRMVAGSHQEHSWAQPGAYLCARFFAGGPPRGAEEMSVTTLSFATSSSSFKFEFAPAIVP